MMTIKELQKNKKFKTKKETYEEYIIDNLDKTWHNNDWSKRKQTD